MTKDANDVLIAGGVCAVLGAWDRGTTTLVEEDEEYSSPTLHSQHATTGIWKKPVCGVRPATDQEEIERLAFLDPFVYERCREEGAKRLGVRVGALDAAVVNLRKSETTERLAPGFLEPPQAWEHEVDGRRLIEDITDTLKRYVFLPEHAATAIALWVLHSYALDSSVVTPILAIESPQRRCGKTTLLSLLQGMVPKPLMAANISTAAVFRAIQEYEPTLLIDEADTFVTADKSELIGVLNSGHNRTSAFVVRTDGDNHDVKVFSTWCAKIIALIGKLPPTLQDRSIVISMRRKQSGETIERRRADRTSDLNKFCRQAARWAADNRIALGNSDPVVPETLDDRARDNWRPLLAIASLIGGNWPEVAKKAAVALSGGRDQDDEAEAVLLLSDIREILVSWLTPKALVDKLVSLDESRWVEWRHGKPISAKAVRSLLKPFGIESKQDRHDGEKSRKYYREDFEDAWARYLPAIPPSRDSTP